MEDKKIIAASEAREMTQQVLEDTHAKGISKVMEAIGKAIAKGTNACVFYEPIAGSVLKELEDLGYNVDSSTDRNETYISISW